MKLRQNWIYLVVLLVIASLFLVACERPLPGGYNNPEAGTDTTLPEVPESVPGVDSYPADAEPAAPVEAAPADAEAYPADAAAPVEGYPADESETAGEEGVTDQELTAEGESTGEEAATDAGQAEAEAATDVEASSEEAAAEGDAATEEGGTEETAETPGSHIVAAGENLYRIGLLYGISWLDLAEANGIVDPANLTVGQELTIPSADSAVEEVVETVVTEEAEAETVEEGAEETEASEESAEEAESTEDSADAEAAEGESTEESAPAAETAETPEGEDAGTPSTYIVQQGDNLYRIGISLGVNWTEIVAANGIVGEQIYPGQELIIPASSDSDGEAEASEAQASEAEADDATGEEISYVVQEGDSIYSIAFDNNIPWTALVEANNIEAPYTLEVGQTLIIVIPAGE